MIENLGNPTYFVWFIHKILQSTLHFFFISNICFEKLFVMITCLCEGAKIT
jgi:hypothetical protein